MNTVTKAKKPKIWVGERHEVFRLRALAWIIEKWPGLCYSQIQSKFVDQFPGVGGGISEQSIAKSVRILHQRGEIVPGPADFDHRAKVWYIK